MKARTGLLVIVIFVAGLSVASAQTPVLGNIETPYANIQTTVRLGNRSWGPGMVAYGPKYTPLVLTGSDLGGGGLVEFIPYKNGVQDTSIEITTATATMWSSNLILVTVPEGASTSMVQVITSEGKASNTLPFMVIAGSYTVSAYCPAGPTNTQLQITTASLSDGAVGQVYSATLGSSGGSGSKTWSITNGSLPGGLSLSSSGTISGTPTGAIGPVDITFEVADSSNPQQTDEAVLGLTVDPQAMNQDSSLYQYSVTSYDGVGNLTGYTDTVMGTWGLQYDSLNRLSLGTQTPSASGSTPQSFCWSYDDFGNRTGQQIAQSGSAGQLFSNSPGAASCTLGSQGMLISNVVTTVGANNQVTGSNARGVSATPVYDAGGGTTFDGENYYWYDAEGRVCATQQTYSILGGTPAFGYLYDADGNRVAKGTVTPSANPATTPISCDPTVNGFEFTENYVLGPSGEELTQIDGGGNWQRTNVYAAGNLLATYDVANSAPALHFYFTDPLGTRRMQVSGMLTNLGQPELDFQSLPYGDQQAGYPDPYAAPTAEGGNLGATPLFFTGKERDTESGNDYFGARYYASTMGRFLSPDWSKNPQGVPYADYKNPQTLNLYSYVQNNPLSSFDDDGHATIEVKYNPLAFGSNHSFIVITDRDGTQTVFRAGPSISAGSGWITPATGGSASQSATPTSSQSDSSNSSSPGAGQTAQGNPWGQLYAQQESPTDPNGDNMSTISGSVTVLSNDLPASSYINGLTQFDTGLNQTQIPYNPLSTNSNAYVTNALQSIGVPTPKAPVWAPGAGTNLNVTPAPPSPPPPPPPPCSVAGACSQPQSQ